MIDLRAELAVRLVELRRQRRVLVPAAFVALAVQTWAYYQVIVANDFWLTSILSSAVAFCFCAWAGLTQRAIERLE